jgi:hypothetical protein
MDLVPVDAAYAGRVLAGRAKRALAQGDQSAARILRLAELLLKFPEISLNMQGIPTPAQFAEAVEEKLSEFRPVLGEDQVAFIQGIETLKKADASLFKI